MILWTLISLTLIYLVVNETRKNSGNRWASFTNPGWGYLATMWFVGSLTIWLLTP